MAAFDKFVDDAVRAEIGHNGREHINPSNTDIDPERTHLNYSFPMNHGGLSNYKYYQKIVGESYLYGRGTLREKDAITACGWVVTLPQELHGHPDKEAAFFRGAFDFISERYGSENIINNAVHYDEGGLPHLHVMYCPITKLDHDIVQYKTVKTTQAIKLESGRYEYEHRFKLDENGERIKLNNYARMSDYYDTKIDCNSVMNKIELRNFHSDFQKYLTDNGIEGAVLTGKTGGVNYTVQELKDFTAKTGMHLDEVKEMQGDKSILESFVERDAKVHQLEQVIHEKDVVIESLQEEILSRDKAIDRADRSEEISHKDEQIRDLSHTLSANNQELEQRLAAMEHTLEEKQRALEQAQSRVEELEKEKTAEVSQTDKEQTWGRSSEGWGDKSQSGWGTRTTDVEEVKHW